MDILLASNNPHKLTEVVRLFRGHVVCTPAEAGLSFAFEENGSTFLENAMGKAQALFDARRTPVLADDSGLCVPALGGEPGIFSSRYGSNGGKTLSTPERNAYLLSRMEGLTDRRAYFVCCMVLFLGEDRYLVAQETVHGTVTMAPRGDNGFGYDPLFLVPGTGRTIAELPDTEKDRLSHRGRAAMRIIAALESGE